MAEPKTRPTGESVTAFLKRATDGDRRKDCTALVRMMKKAVGSPGKMLGPSIVGFGSYQQVYADGHTADWPIIAFSPRKQDLTLYVTNFDERKALLSTLGKHKMSGGCLHIKRLGDVDFKVLERLIAASVMQRRKKPRA